MTVLCMEFGELTDKPFNTRLAANRIGQRLWVNSQHMVKAIGDHWHLLVNPVEQLIRKALVALHFGLAQTRTGVTSSAYQWKPYEPVDPSYLVVGEWQSVSNHMGGGPNKNGAVVSSGSGSFTPEKQKFLKLANAVLDCITSPGFAEPGI